MYIWVPCVLDTGIVFGYVGFNILMVFLLMSLRYVDLPKFGGKGKKSGKQDEDKGAHQSKEFKQEEKNARGETV